MTSTINKERRGFLTYLGIGGATLAATVASKAISSALPASIDSKDQSLLPATIHDLPIQKIKDNGEIGPFIKDIFEFVRQFNFCVPDLVPKHRDPFEPRESDSKRREKINERIDQAKKLKSDLGYNNLDIHYIEVGTPPDINPPTIKIDYTAYSTRIMYRCSSRIIMTIHDPSFHLNSYGYGSPKFNKVCNDMLGAIKKVVAELKELRKTEPSAKIDVFNAEVKIAKDQKRTIKSLS